MRKAVYIYFITQKGKQKLRKIGGEPGSLRYHFFRSVRTLWALNRQGASGGTAKYLEAWIEPMELELTEKALNRLVSKGLARRRKLN